MYAPQFDQLSFPKKGSEIETAALEKIEELKKNLNRREIMLRELLAEQGWNDAADFVMSLDNLLRNNLSGEGVPSEAKAKLQSLAQKVQKERKELEQLSVVIRNIPREREFDLSFDALEYFGF